MPISIRPLLRALFDIDWTTAGANKLLAQITSGGKAYSFTSTPTVSGANITSGTIPSTALNGPVLVGLGGTGVNLNGTGGTSQVLKQVTSGGNITVSKVSASDLSNGVTGNPAALVVMADTPTITTPQISGALSLKGATSGTVTFTAPAVSGTVTNSLLISNNIQFGGGVSTSQINFGGSTSSFAAITSVSPVALQCILADGSDYAPFSAKTLALSTTGGSNQVLQQGSSGGVITAAQLNFNQLAGAATTAQLPTVTAVKGGTGQTAYAVGDILYADTTTTVAKLADVATGQVLISKGVGVAPGYSSTVPIGTGLTFTANPGGGTAATLNDYEVGTWTPTDASGAALTFSTAVGLYVKIGRLVWITVNLVYPTTANASTAQVSLPFTAVTTSAIQALSLSYSSVSVAIIPNVFTNSTTRFNGGLNGATLGVTNAVMSAQQTQYTGIYQSAS